jgi:LuxR family maltose regulon positive regulatory protein
LVEAKLAAPRLRVDMLPRPRIARTLDAGDEAALTLVSAPPGYGKTTAVRAWCHYRQMPFAWVTLDSADNDPVRLWTYIATAVDRVREGLGRSALQRLKVPGAEIESAVDELTNGVAAYDQGLVIVVDDAHSVTDEQCLSALDHFVRQLPSTARLVSITRTDPALRLADLRARSALAELRANELAFTRDEADELLVEGAGLAL